MTLEAKARKLQTLKRKREALDEQITVLEDEIKQEMGEQETLTAGAYNIRWQFITSSRFDTTAFRKEQPELAARYMKQTTSRRFCIN